jgi:hypothetical protein
MKRIFLSLFLLVPLLVAHSQGGSRDAFLGTWELKDKSNDVEIIKKDGLYYIVEFVRIKHELYFSGDNRKAIFQEWGKGPPGDLLGVILSDDGKSIQYYWLSDFGEWQPGAYIYYKK